MENEKLSLTELTKKFFSRKYEYIVPENPIRGRSGQKWKFNGIVIYQDQRYGVFVREWNRSIGVNQIRQLEKACRDTKCAGGIIVGDTFSCNAEIFGENLGIQVVERSTLVRKMQDGI
ncbi:MAG: restriction endonuclease [Promethearchaeota archaeon]